MFLFEEYLKNHKLLVLDGSDLFLQYPNVTVAEIYRKLPSRRERNLRKLYEHVSFGDRSRWYGSWKENIAQYDMVLIINSIRGRDLIEYIMKHNPRARIIVYFETTITPGSRKDPIHYKGLPVEFFSFDKEDACKWGITYQPYFYTYGQEALEETLTKQHPKAEQDVFFVGTDKERLPQLSDLHERMQQLGIRDKMIIVKTPHTFYFGKKRKYVTKERLPYKEIVGHIKKSCCILDIVVDGQSGVTQRPMEALFYQKKLITNDQDIKTYDFYDPQNIFILGQRSLEELPEFIRTPYRPVRKEIIERYTLKYWLETFFAGKTAPKTGGNI